MAITPLTSKALREIAWRDLLTVHAKLVRKMDADLAAAGLNPLEWYDVLLTLNEAPGRRLRLSELADRVLISRSGVTRLVDRIEAKGLLARERCGEDRRGAYAVLTDAGFQELRRMWVVYSQIIAEQFGRHMTDDEAVTLHRVFARMLPQPAVALTVSGGRATRESPPVPR